MVFVIGATVFLLLRYVDIFKVWLHPKQTSLESTRQGLGQDLLLSSRRISTISTLQ